MVESTKQLCSYTQRGPINGDRSAAKEDVEEIIEVGNEKDVQTEVHDLPTTTKSHTNNAFTPDESVVTATIEAPSSGEKKIAFIDAAMQTSGEWSNILSSLQTPTTSRLVNQPQPNQTMKALQATDQDSIDKAESIEMTALGCETASEAYSYCNKAYLADTPIIGDSKQKDSGRVLVAEEHNSQNTSQTSNANSQLENIKQTGKSVTFSGCRVISENNNDNETQNMHKCDAGISLGKLRFRIQQSLLPEDKWQRVRAMEFHQQVVIMPR